MVETTPNEGAVRGEHWARCHASNSAALAHYRSAFNGVGEAKSHDRPASPPVSSQIVGRGAGTNKTSWLNSDSTWEGHSRVENVITDPQEKDKDETISRYAQQCDVRFKPPERIKVDADVVKENPREDPVKEKELSLVRSEPTPNDNKRIKVEDYSHDEHKNGPGRRGYYVPNQINAAVMNGESNTNHVPVNEKDRPTGALSDSFTRTKENKQVCSIFKVSKTEMNNFSKTQWKKGSNCKAFLEEGKKEQVTLRKSGQQACKQEIAECNRMKNLEATTCVVCNTKKKRSNFTKGQWKIKYGSTCNSCAEVKCKKNQQVHKTNEAVKKINFQQESVGGKMIECSSCKVAKRRNEFDAIELKLLRGQSKCRGCRKKIQAKACNEFLKTKKAAKKKRNLVRSCSKSMTETDRVTINVGEAMLNRGTKRGFSELEDKTQNKAALNCPIRTSNDESTTPDDTARHTRPIKKKTTTTETELGDGTKIVDTETVEIHPDGLVVKKIKTESTLENITHLPNGSRTIEKIVTVTKSTTESRTKVEYVFLPAPKST